MAAGGSAATEAGADSAGQAGNNEAGEANLGGGCTDLDHDGKSDCDETAVENSTFNRDVAHWQAEDGAIQRAVAVFETPIATALVLSLLASKWIYPQAPRLFWAFIGAAESGSALVTSSKLIDDAGDSLVAADQCVAVSSGQVVDIFANAYIDPGIAGKAAINLWFFPEPDCPGDSSSEVYETVDAYDSGKLLTLVGTKSVPEQMVSMRVRLSVIKAFRTPSFSVRFDNVLLTVGDR